MTCCNDIIRIIVLTLPLSFKETKKAGSSKGQKRQGPKESGTSQSKKSKAASTIDKENLVLAKAQVCMLVHTILLVDTLIFT